MSFPTIKIQASATWFLGVSGGQISQPGAHQLGALLLILALMFDMKFNLIMAIYKIIVAAGNALWE